MTVDKFQQGVEQIARRKPAYTLKHDGSDDMCDCVGLIIGATRLAGDKYTGIHGSNWYARHYTKNLRVATAGNLTRGGIVFKKREPGESGYSLPSRYDKDPDKRDYYHIGIVWSVSPLRIVHCTSLSNGVFNVGGTSFKSGSITTDTKLGKWTYTGESTFITDYDNVQQGGTGMERFATVTAPGGNNVNMREKPLTSAAQVTRVPIGAMVTIINDLGEWCEIRYRDYAGYMMSNYLEYDGMENDTDAGEMVKVNREEIKKVIEILSAMIAKG